MPVDLGTRKQRALVAALAMNRGRPVSVDALVELLWPAGAPPGVTGTLQAYCGYWPPSSRRCTPMVALPPLPASAGP